MTTLMGSLCTRCVRSASIGYGSSSRLARNLLGDASPLPRSARSPGSRHHRLSRIFVTKVELMITCVVHYTIDPSRSNPSSGSRASGCGWWSSTGARITATSCRLKEPVTRRRHSSALGASRPRSNTARDSVPIQSLSPPTRSGTSPGASCALIAPSCGPCCRVADQARDPAQRRPRLPRSAQSLRAVWTWTISWMQALSVGSGAGSDRRRARRGPGGRAATRPPLHWPQRSARACPGAGPAA